MVIESWAHCVAGPLLEVMDKLGLSYPQGMLLLPVIKLAADITECFSNVFVYLQWGIVCGTHCTSWNSAAQEHSNTDSCHAQPDKHLPPHQCESAMVAFVCSWAAYVAGPLVVLMHELGLRYPQGISLLLSSAVPEGKGVSSSAAVEVAVMQALCAAHDVHIDGRHLALLCQKVTARCLGEPNGAFVEICGHQMSMLCHHSKLDELLESGFGAYCISTNHAGHKSLSGACLVCAPLVPADRDDSLHTSHLACHCVQVNLQMQKFSALSVNGSAYGAGQACGLTDPNVF